MRHIFSSAFVLLLTASALVAAQRQAGREVRAPSVLKDNWSIQSSAKVTEQGAAISTPQFRTAGWYPAHVPSTVMATLVENNLYPDIFFGMNLRSVPGCSYKIGQNFSNVPMPDDSPFRHSWWYRTEFPLSERDRGRRIWLHFDGINYRANIWLNGRQIADARQVAGTFRLYEFDITEAARVGGVNALAVEIFPPQPGELALTWVDWNPAPPDKNMGIWHGVYVTTSGPVTLRHPQIITRVDLPKLDAAHLTINAEVRNTSARVIEGRLRGRVGDVRFALPLRLAPREMRTVVFSPEQFRQLNIPRPRLWWPVDTGPQNLYELQLDFETEGHISDRQTASFGIREVTSELDQDGHRFFRVNGRRILIRGGGWSSDMLLRYRPERLAQEFEYVRDMHLNAIRLEGKLESDYFYKLADRLGILVIAGWCCCDHWEHWTHRDDYKEGPTWDAEDYEVARHSMEDQVRRLRNHPSLLVWMNGSDNVPPPEVEKMYIAVLEKFQWPNPYVSSATAKVSAVTGRSGVKMEGPYEWVPPSYWLLDQKSGGAHGFATEISPGPAVPPVESLRRMLPAEHLWPIDEYWSYHAGGGQFKKLDVFTDALSARYGPAKNVEDYAAKAQLMTYEGQRAMFEGYARNRASAGGVIQWMLNNAWPSMIWHLYDYYLRPAGGYYGTKKACQPVHVQYSYDDRSIVAVNNTSWPADDVKVSATIYDIEMVEKYTNSARVSVPAGANVRAFAVPIVQPLTTTYFLSLRLEAADGKILSTNFYWLSTKDDVLDWAKSTWYYTPVSSFADFTALQSLPPITLVARGRTERRGEIETAQVTIENSSRSVALAVHLQIKRRGDGEEVLPVLWEDNYFALLPGEKREVTARYDAKELAGQAPSLAVGGWRVRPQAQALTARR